MRRMRILQAVVATLSLSVGAWGFALPVRAQSSGPTALPAASASPISGGGHKERGTKTPATPIRPAANPSSPEATPAPRPSSSPIRPVPSPSAS